MSEHDMEEPEGAHILTLTLPVRDWLTIDATLDRLGGQGGSVAFDVRGPGRLLGQRYRR
ncbi:hypothetical protein [Nonomuraea sp. NPDC003709]|uniref:hypothetical protein n=1 Tax=Nonomuraea sp. NPDC003709 TaxID=3154450 RepID=UPI0033A9C008